MWVCAGLYPSLEISKEVANINNKLLVAYKRGTTSRRVMALGFCLGVTSFWLPKNKSCSFASRTSRPGWWIPHTEISASQALFLVSQFERGYPYCSIWGRNVHSCFRSPSAGIILLSMDRFIHRQGKEHLQDPVEKSGRLLSNYWVDFQQRNGVVHEICTRGGHVIPTANMAIKTGGRPNSETTELLNLYPHIWGCLNCA